MQHRIDMATSFSQAKIPSLVTAPCLLEVSDPVLASNPHPILYESASMCCVKIPVTAKLVETVLQLWNMFSRLNAGTIEISHIPWGENCIYRFMHPVLDRLLRYRCPRDMCQDHAAIHEAFRISGLLSLAQLRRMLGVAPVPTASYVSQVQQVLFEYRPDWSGLEAMKLWCLAAMALEVQDQLLYQSLVLEASELISAAGFGCVQGVLREIERVMWTDADSWRRLQAFWSDMTW